MPAEIEVWGGVRATIQNGRWVSENADLVEILESLSDAADISPSQGDGDIAIAENAARLLEGQVVSAVSAPVASKAIY